MKEINFEQTKNIVAKIKGEVIRHSKKLSDYPTDPELSPEGIELALNGHEPLDNALVKGSPKKRAGHTAALKAFGEDVKGDNFEQTKEILDADLNYGSHAGVDSRLDFNGDSKSEYGKKFYEAFFAGKYLSFLAEESDSYAKEVGDTEGSTCGRMAGNIAQIFENYLKAIDNWEEALKKDADKENPQYISNELNRILGTHQGVGEAFLIKLIEKTSGVAERDNFIKALNNQGFDFTEGFQFEIDKFDDGTKIIHFSFNKELPNGEKYSFEKDVSQDLLEEIVKEGKM